LAALRRKSHPLSSIPALITSTEAAQTDFDAARLAGANFYLVKPIDGKKLLEFAALMTGAEE
jgi:two-component system chemotaxis response regulator CheY